jgi:glycosyltransferase involved in cell wall biosynthesis
VAGGDREGVVNVALVSYSLGLVGDDAVGGAEVVLARLEAGLVARGHRTTVIAPDGSRVRGELAPGARIPPEIDEAAHRRAHEAHRAAIARVLAQGGLDVVHYHGVDVVEMFPPRSLPVIATLHLPFAFYGDKLRALDRPNVTMVCVSRAQRDELPPELRVRAAVVPNGVDVASYRAGAAKAEHALVLGRICPEKGVHLAIDACRRAGVPLVIAGDVHAYPTHVRYWDEQIAPRLGPGVRWLGAVHGERKRELLAGARVLIVPSLVAETSSLVTMEALASGTPVIAMRRGALPSLIADGETGVLVDDLDGMVAALGAIDRIDPAACRAAAARDLDERVMIERYAALYERAIAAFADQASSAASARA